MERLMKRISIAFIQTDKSKGHRSFQRTSAIHLLSEVHSVHIPSKPLPTRSLPTLPPQTGKTRIFSQGRYRAPPLINSLSPPKNVHREGTWIGVCVFSLPPSHCSRNVPHQPSPTSGGTTGTRYLAWPIHVDSQVRINHYGRRPGTNQDNIWPWTNYGNAL